MLNLYWLARDSSYRTQTILRDPPRSNVQLGVPARPLPSDSPLPVRRRCPSPMASLSLKQLGGGNQSGRTRPQQGLRQGLEDFVSCGSGTDDLACCSNCEQVEGCSVVHLHRQVCEPAFSVSILRFFLGNAFPVSFLFVPPNNYWWSHSRCCELNMEPIKKCLKDVEVDESRTPSPMLGNRGSHEGGNGVNEQGCGFVPTSAVLQCGGASGALDGLHEQGHCTVHAGCAPLCGVRTIEGGFLLGSVPGSL
ncbi:uncharacterized protein J3R85_005566 [Psidium guajava]|nr:uncharacterized protein J3R85_005566 [Psidium guajava]